MDWIVLQLTPWAAKTKTSSDLHDAIRRYKYLRNLEFFYPVIEDEHGKYDTGFAEYAFLEYRVDTNYDVLENTEEFIKVLRSSNESPQLVTNTYVENIRQQVVKPPEISESDVVLVVVGPLKGNKAKVAGVEDSFVCLEVEFGSETLTATLPINWIKIISRKEDL